MTWDATDWTILRTTGTNPLEIDYVGDAHAGTAPTYATGIELHRALQDYADDQSDGTEEISIVDEIPSQRGGVDTNITLINGYHITPTAAEHLYDTSISQTHPVDGIQIYDGIQVFGNSTSIQIIQDGALLSNDFWNEAKMIAAVEDATSSTSHRFMLLVHDGGADIDGRRLIGTQRVYGTTYTEFSIGGGTNRGNNVLALTANSNLNNTTNQATIDALTFTIAEGYVPITVGAFTDNYYVQWRVQTPDTKNQAYEYSQNMIREGVSATPVIGTFGLDPNIFRGITHSVAVTDQTSGIWVEPEALSWGTGATAGTGQLLAIDDTASGSATILYMQHLTGVLPSGNLITAATNGASGTAGTVTGKVISVPPIGASTGSNLKTAYGVGVHADDLASGDTLLSLEGGARNAPNNVTFDVIGLNITTTADYVLVGPDSAGALDLAQLANETLLNTTTTSVSVGTGNIPADTPATGTIRIERDSGEYTRHPYSGYDGTNTTFTITSHDFSGDPVAATNNIFISYVDKVATATTESFNTVFDSTRALRIIVRNGESITDIAPIVPIDTAGSLGSGGGSTTISRQLDT